MNNSKMTKEEKKQAKKAQAIATRNKDTKSAVIKIKKDSFVINSDIAEDIMAIVGLIDERDDKNREFSGKIKELDKKIEESTKQAEIDTLKAEREELVKARGNMKKDYNAQIFGGKNSKDENLGNGRVWKYATEEVINGYNRKIATLGAEGGQFKSAVSNLLVKLLNNDGEVPKLKQSHYNKFADRLNVLIGAKMTSSKSRAEDSSINRLGGYSKKKLAEMVVSALADYIKACNM